MFLPQWTQRARREKGCRIRDAGCRDVGYLLPVSGILNPVLCVLCALCGESLAVAAPQQVVPVDGAAFSAELVSVAANGNVAFRLKEKGEPVVIKSGDLVRWGNPVTPKPQTLVVLADGGRLVTAADWSGGAAVRLNGDDVLVMSDTWGEIRLPRNLVSGIVFAQRSRAEQRERLAERIAGDASPSQSQQGRGSPTADAVLLTNGDRLTGTLAALERGSLTLQTSAGETKLPLSRVEAIVFQNSRRPSAISRQLPASEPSPSPSLKGRGILVGTRDGSLLNARAIEAGPEKMTIELTNNVELTGGQVAEVVALQSLGGRFEYLSDIERADYRFVPYLNIEWPLARDRNVLGEPLTADGKRYSKGLGLHTAARVTYQFDRDYQRFDATVALDDAAHGRGSLVFGAYVLRDGKWAEAYKSDVVRGGESPQPVSVDLRGAQGLTITVDYADRGDELDYADWLDARLVR